MRSFLLITLCLTSLILAWCPPMAEPTPDPMVEAVRLQRAGQHGPAAEQWKAEIVAANEAGQKRPTEQLQQLAFTLYKSGRYDEALTTCDELWRMDKKNPRSYYIKGLVLQKTGKMADARTAYGQALMYGETLAAGRLRQVSQ